MQSDPLPLWRGAQPIVYLRGVDVVLGADSEALAAVLLAQPVGEPPALGVVEPLTHLPAVHHRHLIVDNLAFVIKIVIQFRVIEDTFC